jgi:hypothetical protein
MWVRGSPRPAASTTKGRIEMEVEKPVPGPPRDVEQIEIDARWLAQVAIRRLIATQAAGGHRRHVRRRRRSRAEWRAAVASGRVDLGAARAALFSGPRRALPPAPPADLVVADRGRRARERNQQRCQRRRARVRVATIRPRERRSRGCQRGAGQRTRTSRAAPGDGPAEPVNDHDCVSRGRALAEAPSATQTRRPS